MVLSWRASFVLDGVLCNVHPGPQVRARQRKIPPALTKRPKRPRGRVTQLPTYPRKSSAHIKELQERPSASAVPYAPPQYYTKAFSHSEAISAEVSHNRYTMAAAIKKTCRHYLLNGDMLIAAEDPGTGEFVMMLEQRGQRYVRGPARADSLSAERPRYAQHKYARYLDGPKVPATTDNTW